MLFLELHLNGIIEYLFLLLGSFIQDNVSEIYSGCFIIINLSLFVACNNSTLYEYTMFVYSPVVGRLGCFQFLSIKSKSYWGYFRTRLFMDLVFIFLEKYLTVELQVLKQMGSARCFRTHPRGSHVIPEEGFRPGGHNLDPVVMKHQINLSYGSHYLKIKRPSSSKISGLHKVKPKDCARLKETRVRGRAGQDPSQLRARSEGRGFGEASLG